MEENNMKNEIKAFKNEELGLQIRTIINKDGSISMSAEDTAVGFGWCRDKNGKNYVMWDRFNNFSSELGFPHKCGKDDYIPESLYYLLGMKASNERATKYQRWLAIEVLPSIRKTGTYEIPKKDKPKKKNLSSVNMAAKILKETYREAGVEPLYIAVAVDKLYKDEAGIDFGIQLTTKESKLYDYTEIAKELGMLSKTGNPHDKAVSAIVQKIEVSEDEKVTTPFERNGHADVTVQYKESVFVKVKQWLKDNSYPLVIKYELSNGKVNNCTVYYRNMEVA